MRLKLISINNYPLPVGGVLRHDSVPQLIGMIHVLSNNIMIGQNDWNKALGIPRLKSSDLSHIFGLTTTFRDMAASMKNDFGQVLSNDDFDGVLGLHPDINDIYRHLEKLSFINYLVDRAIAEVEQYRKNNVNIIQLENVGAPYFLRNEIPIFDRALMSYIASKLRLHYPDLPMGIQVLAYGDNIALEIAHRYKMFYVRGESFLFKGVRPEGENPVSGSLAKAYMARNIFSLVNDSRNDFPKIYPDLMKKHTVFTGELTDLQAWVGTLAFSKVEGAIITGKHTGAPVDEKDMVLAREAVNKAYNDFGVSIPLLSGSGVNSENISKYKQYFNAIIFGSPHKVNGYWENPIDPDRLAKFMEAFNRG